MGFQDIDRHTLTRWESIARADLGQLSDFARLEEGGSHRALLARTGPYAGPWRLEAEGYKAK